MAINGDIAGDKVGGTGGFGQDFALVPFYNVEASAGSGRLVDEESVVCEMAFRRDWLQSRGLNVRQCVLIKARGDSMEPTIYDGDLLLVDTRISSVVDDAIYIVHSDHALIVKRIQQSVNGTLIIISDNSRYKDVTLPASETDTVNIVGRVRWYGHEM